MVKSGDLLFVIDPRPYQAEYGRALADVKPFKTALELARIELVRVQRLRDSGAVSEEELDQRKSTVAQGEANVAGSEAALETASLNLNFTKVTSPIAGRVSRAEVTRGNLVTGGNNGGTLLTSVVSMDPIYLVLRRRRTGLPALHEDGSFGRTYRARAMTRNPVQVGLADERDSRTPVRSISSTINSIRKPEPFGRVRYCRTKTDNSRPACSRAYNCWAAASIRPS